MRLHPNKTTLKNGFIRLVYQIKQITTFSLLLFAYLISQLVVSLFHLFRRPINLQPFYHHLQQLFDADRKNRISRLDLIELSLNNMRTKRTRTIITIGGMTIGIATIVFLVSIGYGLQQLVINRVARLEEMRQTDIMAQVGGQVKVTDKTLSDLKDIPQVENSLPMINVVGKISYQNSITDVAAYGVTTDYMKQSAIKPVKGRIFDNNQITVTTTSTGEVAGASTDRPLAAAGHPIGQIEFTIPSDTWLRVRTKPDKSAKLLGYTTHQEGVQTGEEVWGSSYIHTSGRGDSGQSESGESLGKWIKFKAPLWKHQSCDLTNPLCVSGEYIVMVDENDIPLQQEGYIAETEVMITQTGSPSPQVLGDSTSVDWVEIASESAAAATISTKTVSLTPTGHEVVVNRSLLKVLGIKENEALDKKFSVSFIVIGDLLTNNNERIESLPMEYTIVGITPDERSPHFYVPFIDLRSLGVTNYSQVKVVVNDKASLPKVRRQIEAMGYVTNSVADTVSQINNLFSTIRRVLAAIGLIALAIAALGMFNTLTVSLLERTREVGLMKAMGMKSNEIQELFLTESMIMGSLGGFFGIFIGFILGKFLEIILSFFTISKGLGFVSVTNIPVSLSLSIILLSLFIGVVTGIFPARRATKISALNALRYE